MFGSKDDQQQDPNQTTQFQAEPPVTPTVPDPTPAATLESGTPDPAVPPVAPSAPQAPPELPGMSKFADKVVAPPAPPHNPGPVGGSPVVSDDLMSLKQNALQQLSPLLSHLDQTPEERFRTTMMMIQATDDSSKIKDAYEAAQAITDEKARAQALLDVVNEINYFTQQHQPKQP